MIREERKSASDTNHGEFGSNAFVGDGVGHFRLQSIQITGIENQFAFDLSNVIVDFVVDRQRDVHSFLWTNTNVSISIFSLSRKQTRR